MKFNEIPSLMAQPVTGVTVMPYHRIYRPCRKSHNSGYNSWRYIVDHEYADSPANYTQPFLSLQKEIIDLFEYVEPAYKNLKTYSYRIQQLLMRTCIEIEANFKAIFNENTFTLKSEDHWNINDYRKINVSHHLSSYTIKFPRWEGKCNEFRPFQPWAENESLSWYRAYNATKHNRVKKREQANFYNLLSAYSALAILLAAQFRDKSFTPGPSVFADGGSDSYYGAVEYAIGDYLIIEYPSDWTDDELYNYEWEQVKNIPNKFRKYNYDVI